MQKLREFLENILKNTIANNDFDTGRASLAEHILSEYLTDSKFCQCELCKKQHELIGLK